MKLPIKKKYFDQIKAGTKDVEYRDAHITFICEETGETLRKDVTEACIESRSGRYADVCQDEWLISFRLKKEGLNGTD